MPRRECRGAWTDQPHRSTCRELLRPARAEDVERARRAETPSVRVAADIAAGRVQHLSEPFRSMPRSIPNNPDFKREPPLVSIDVELASAQRCPGCGGIYCDRGDVCGWRPMPTSEPVPAQIAEALRRAMPAIKATVNHVDQPQGDKVTTSHAPYAAGAIHDEAHRAIFGDNEGQWMALRRRMNNAGFVAGVDFQRTPADDQVVIVCSPPAPARAWTLQLHGCPAMPDTATIAHYDSGDWCINVPARGVIGEHLSQITFCPFCGEKLATEGA